VICPHPPTSTSSGSRENACWWLTPDRNRWVCRPDHMVDHRQRRLVRNDPIPSVRVIRSRPASNCSMRPATALLMPRAEERQQTRRRRVIPCWTRDRTDGAWVTPPRSQPAGVVSQPRMPANSRSGKRESHGARERWNQLCRHTRWQPPPCGLGGVQREIEVGPAAPPGAKLQVETLDSCCLVQTGTARDARPTKGVPMQARQPIRGRGGQPGRSGNQREISRQRRPRSRSRYGGARQSRGTSAPGEHNQLPQLGCSR